MTTDEVQLICRSNSSSISTQQSSVANRFARPPAARRISSDPQPISDATAMTASSSLDLALLELGHPDLAHTFGLEQLDVFLAEHVSLGQELLAPRTEDRAAEDSPGGFLDIDGLSFHLPPDPKLYKWLGKIQRINSRFGRMFFAGIPAPPLGLV